MTNRLVGASSLRQGVSCGLAAQPESRARKHWVCLGIMLGELFPPPPYYSLYIPFVFFLKCSPHMLAAFYSALVRNMPFGFCSSVLYFPFWFPSQVFVTSWWTDGKGDLQPVSSDERRWVTQSPRIYHLTSNVNWHPMFPDWANYYKFEYKEIVNVIFNAHLSSVCWGQWWLDNWTCFLLYLRAKWRVWWFDAREQTMNHFEYFFFQTKQCKGSHRAWHIITKDVPRIMCFFVQYPNHHCRPASDRWWFLLNSIFNQLTAMCVWIPSWGLLGAHWSVAGASHFVHGPLLIKSQRERRYWQ